MADSPDVLAEIEAGLREHSGGDENLFRCKTCYRPVPCSTHRALTGWKKAEERAQQWETATGVALNREHAEQQRRFKAWEEKRALVEALEFEAIGDCACHCCVQRVARAREALAPAKESK